MICQKFKKEVNTIMIDGSLKIMHNFIKISLKGVSNLKLSKDNCNEKCAPQNEKKGQIFEVEILALFDKLPFIVFSNHKNSFESIDFCQKILLFRTHHHKKFHKRTDTNVLDFHFQIIT